MEFSESSYAFAMVRELTDGDFGPVLAAPEFPTLRSEGATGGGFDVKLKYNAVALFLQFKVPKVVTRSSKQRPDGFPIPYYRVPLRTKSPNQHQLLVDLEAPNRLVFYVSPEFHEGQEFNRLYRQKGVSEHSAYFKPRDIGQLDRSQHHVIYAQGVESAYVHSEPKLLQGQRSRDAVLQQIKIRMVDSQVVAGEDFVAELSGSVVRIANQLVATPKSSEGPFLTLPSTQDAWDPNRPRMRQLPANPFRMITEAPRNLNEVAQIARSHLGCELIIFGK